MFLAIEERFEEAALNKDKEGRLTDCAGAHTGRAAARMVICVLHDATLLEADVLVLTKRAGAHSVRAGAHLVMCLLWIDLWEWLERGFQGMGTHYAVPANGRVLFSVGVIIARYLREIVGSTSSSSLLPPIAGDHLLPPTAETINPLLSLLPDSSDDLVFTATTSIDDVVPAVRSLILPRRDHSSRKPATSVALHLAAVRSMSLRQQQRTRRRTLPQQNPSAAADLQPRFSTLPVGFPTLPFLAHIDLLFSYGDTTTIDIYLKYTFSVE
ncbi:hypothetical protein LXL04_012638 [Taraxacum kok-saghyz]